MTPKEAIDYLNDPIGKGLKAHDEAIKMAVAALKKQIPQKPVMGYAFPEKIRTIILAHGDKERAEAKTECCPACGRALGTSQFVKQQTGASFGDLFCKRCGQAIDWSQT